MEGRLFSYTKKPRRMVAFESHPVGLSKKLVFIGGLGDGFLATPYLPALASAVAELGYSLVQVQLSSFAQGYGDTTLTRFVPPSIRVLHTRIFRLYLVESIRFVVRSLTAFMKCIEMSRNWTS